MVSEKALYWMAVGLMALVVGNHFVDRFDGRALASRSLAVGERISAGSEHVLAMALGGSQRDRAQAMVGRAQAMVARRDAACARIEAQRARLMGLQSMQQLHLRVIAPHQNFRIEIPEIRVPQTPVNLHDDRI